jgi:hypothetical protein
MPGDVGLVAALLTKVFGWAVDPTGFALMEMNHKLEVIHAGINVALDKGDNDTVDLLFQQYRELRQSAS